MLKAHLHTTPPLPIRAFFLALSLAIAVALAPPDLADAGDSNVDNNYVFPLPSKHTYGDGYGAGRGHDGQDLFAPCGRKLVAAHDGRVQMAQYDSSGYGNILVLDVKGSGVDLLYAHMKNRAVVRVGRRVNAGEKVGEVGQTGNASGCHLHFEMHTAPGFWEGGRPMQKVTEYLKKWDRYS
ncbi:MAG: M23 family metallopeptidase [Actinomycetota bacterium]|nr:M23 family metallopeptidase [Actinomycetota bacterium]